MNLVDCKIKIKCDMPNCKNFADVKIENEGFVKSIGLYLCKDCMNELYSTIGKHIVPKSPDNMLNKKIVSKRVSGNEK